MFCVFKEKKKIKPYTSIFVNLVTPLTCPNTFFLYSLYSLYTYFYLQLLSLIYDYYDLTICFSLLQMVRTCWLYYFSKFIELLDTVSICSLIKEVVMFPFHSRRNGAVGG